MSIIDKFSLQGKVSLVTGGERGIGLAIAVAFAQAGSDIIVAGLDEASVPQAKELITREGRNFTFIKTDVTQEEQVVYLLSEITKHYGKLDILCNNAGIGKRAEAVEMPLDMWREVIEVNLTSQFLVSREVGKIMFSRGKGSIVNIASMSGLIVNTPQSQCNYNASKAGVISLTKSLASEWAKHGVRVNAIAPGYICTPLTERRFADYNDPMVRTWNAMTPMGRLGVPDEIAGAALYFASDASTFTTGAVLSVDGGYTIW